MDPCIAIDVQTLTLGSESWTWVSLAGDCTFQQIQQFVDLGVTLLFHPFKGWIA